MELLVLLTLAATCLASLSGHTVESQSQAKAYWKAKLGNTRMPKAIIDSIEATKEHPSTIIEAQGLEEPNIDKYDLERFPFYNRRYIATSKEDPSTSQGLEAANINKYDLERFPLIYNPRDVAKSKADPSTSQGLEAANIDKYDLERFPLYNRRYVATSKEDPSTSQGLEATNIDKYDLERFPLYNRRNVATSKEDPSTSQGLEATNIDKYDLERFLLYNRRYVATSKEDPSTSQGLEAANIDKYDLERFPLYNRRYVATSKEDPSTSQRLEAANFLSNATKFYSRQTPASIISRVGLDIFFFSNHLTHPGGTLKLHFNYGCKSKFLPIELAKLIPFSHDKVPEILSLFSVRPDSTQARLMKDTIICCEESPVGGEDDKYCATSLEDLVDYVISKIGSHVKVLSTTIDKDVTAEYTIEKAHKVSSDGNFVCHKARYPYAVFHCHTIRNTDAYVVSLIDANGQKSKAAAVCHRDTSSWNPEHVAFQLLKVEPGSVPICHFVGAHDMIWTWNDMPLATDQAQFL